MEMSILCRGCMRKLTAWEIENFDKKTINKFTFCTKIEVEEDDKLPQKFCVTCIVRIETSYTYIQKAQEVNVKLRKLVPVTKHEPDTHVKCDVVDDSKLNLQKAVKIEIDNEDVNSESDHDTLFIDEQCYNDDLDEKDIKENDDEVDDKQNEPVPNYDCLKCNKTFKSEWSYKRHAAICSKDKPQTRSAKTNDGIKNDVVKTVDIQIKNPDKTSYEKTRRKLSCRICKKNFGSKKWLNKHVLNVHRRRKNKDFQKEVLVRIDGKKAPVRDKECSMCERVFTTELFLSRHVEMVHSTDKTYFCPVCPKSFTTQHKLSSHVKRHPELRKYKCESCDKRYRTVHQLAVHRVTHGDARQHPCSKCDKAFTSRSLLEEHYKRHQSDRSHLCEVCGDTFTTAKSLSLHMSRHTGAKPLQCPVCPLRTAYPCALATHMRKHQAHRPYQCAHCTKAFYERGSLERHTRIHTGERPYACPRCARAFVDAWKCKTHMMRAHAVPLEHMPAIKKNNTKRASEV